MSKIDNTIKFEYIRNLNNPEQVLTIAYKMEDKRKSDGNFTMFAFAVAVNKCHRQPNCFGRQVFVGDRFEKKTARKISSDRLREISNYQIAIKRDSSFFAYRESAAELFAKCLGECLQMIFDDPKYSSAAREIALQDLCDRY